VVGSGGAGLAAAVAAAARSAEVTVLEAATLLGGTTAISGGGIWIPANPWAAAAGVEDSAEEALAYLRALELGDSDRALSEVYVREGPRVARAVEARTPLRWQHLTGFPDYHVELGGGQPLGRSLEIRPVQVEREVLARVRPDPYGQPPITILEGEADRPDAEELARREREGIVARGRGLVAALLATLLELGGEARTATAATRLLTSDGAVVGVEASGERFDGEVVIASGGFERDPALVRAFLRGPLTAPAGPPSNRGAGLRMGMAAGAALGNMSEAWWCPAMAVDGETIDGAPFFRMLFMDLAKQGGLLVDRHGRRFVDEAANYNDLGRALHGFDAAEYAFPRAPSWLVLDATRRAEHSLGPLTRDDPDPAWLVRAATPEQLAARIGLDPRVLRETIERWNDGAARGVDPDFGRGSYVWDRFSGAGADLRPLVEAPFYALQVLPGCLGTNGGLRIDAHGRVLRADDGAPIPGLYAAGNAAASPFGCAYPGPGSTIGPAVVFGWRAGENAAAAA
jgi:succinate dehydrogenase/fumarate reductase flavoprotein subunit